MFCRIIAVSDLYERSVGLFQKKELTVTNNSHLIVDKDIRRWYVMYWVLAL